MIWQIFALGCALSFIIGFLIGGFIYWDEYQPILRKNRRELREAYMEQERLRMKIYEMKHLVNPSKAK